MPIDRPTEDDTPRTRPETRAADLPPPQEHESPDRMAYAAEYRATVGAVIQKYQATREWDEVVPALRQAWETHEKKWTYPERTGPTVHPEVAGAWRGDGDRCLAPDANAEVARGSERIREVGETVITPAMRRIEAEDPTRHLAGFDYRLKGENRLKEKVSDELEARPGLTAGQGINTQWREPETGQRFEVQCHTRASFEAKQLSHDAYERIRNPQTSELELDELRDFQHHVCGKIPVPLGASEIDDPPRKEHDG